MTQYSRGDITTGGQESSRFTDILNQNRLSLRNTGGYVFHPRLLTFTLGGDFGLFQEHFSSDGTSGTNAGTLYGYEAFIEILSEAPYSLNLFANRSQNINTQALGGRTETVQENRGATLYARQIYVPSILSLRQEVRTEDTRAAGIVAHRDETRNILTYQGNRGWEDSEASLRYEFTDLSDHVFPNLDYRSHEGYLFYSLDFGPELNRRWDSRIRLFTRSGISELTTGTVDETLRIDHTDRLQTFYRYSLLRVETGGGATTTHTGSFNLRHRLYESLTTNLFVNAVLATLPGGETETYGGRLDLAYRKRLPWNGLLNIGLGGGMQYQQNRFGAPETFVPQETHTAATPFALPIQLGNPFVIAASIVVTKTAVGPVPVGCVPPSGPPTPLVLGRDYTLTTAGDITQIVPVPCAGAIPGINPGDTIAVDYRFAVPTSLAYTTETVSTNVSVDYGWVRPYASVERTNQNLVSGRDGQFLDDVRSDTAGTEFRYDGQRLRATFLGEGKHHFSRRVAYDTARTNQFLGFTILPELTLAVTGNEAWFQYAQPRRQTRTLTGRAIMTYTLGGDLFGEAFAGIGLLKDTLVATERTIDAGVRVRWTFRKLEVDPTLQFFDRRRGDTDTKDYRAILHVIRRF